MLKRLLKFIYMYFTLLGRYFTIQYLLGLSLISITLKILDDHCHQKIYQVIATSNANYSCSDDGEIWFKYFYLQGIESLKNDNSHQKKGYWLSLKATFGHPFSWKWFSPFSTPKFAYSKPYLHCVWLLGTCHLSKDWS